MPKARLLSIDPGRKYLGLAISRYGKLAEGLTTISSPTLNQQMKKILKIINQYQPQKIIIGRPKKGPIYKLSNQIGDRLKNSVNLPIIYVDEDKSSLQAKETLINLGKKKKSQDQIHQVAAAKILQNYIEDLLQ